MRAVDYQWVALGATTLLGLAGIVAAAWQGERGRRHGLQQAQLGHASQARIASHTLYSQRMADAYIAMLDQTERMAQYLDATRPMLDEGQPRRELPNLDEQAMTVALVQAYGSRVVRFAFQNWRAHVNEMLIAARELDRYDARDKGHSDGATEVRRRLDVELRPAERHARDTLRDVARAELGNVNDSVDTRDPVAL